MSVDRTLGQEQLESSTSLIAQQQLALKNEWPANTATVIYAAACPVHGCCAEESAEEYERWDGLS